MAAKIDTPARRKTIIAELADGVPATPFYLAHRAGITEKQVKTLITKMVKAKEIAKSHMAGMFTHA